MNSAICQRTGISFEAHSKRQKNHPRVSEFLDAANKEGRHYIGAYAAAGSILEEVKQAGITDIDEAMDYAAAQFAKWKSSDAKVFVRKTNGDRIRELKERKRQRDEVNAILKPAGYRWEREEYGTEEEFMPGSYNAGIGELAGYRWVLYAPDGRMVSVQQALKEINSREEL